MKKIKEKINEKKINKNHKVKKDEKKNKNSKGKK